MTLEELNEHTVNGTIGEVIAVAEAKQCKAISAIADDICSRRGARLVLLAGGSSAGKTTTASRLSTHLRVNDRAAFHFSTDDYFVGDEKNPRDADGNLDYEHVQCVDIPDLVRDISVLIDGGQVAERRFDFMNHVPKYTGRMISLPAGGYVVLEGIHALNPLISEGIDDACKYKIYIDPKPQIEIFGSITPKSSDARFLRRMVRDNQFRKMSPADTVRLWPKVLEGERKWIEPFSAAVDANFDSYLVYELAVLKNYVGGLLELARRELGEVREVMNMIRLLNPVMPVNATKVPGDSILRETIGGSLLDY
jgi:uridine kinase